MVAAAVEVALERPEDERGEQGLGVAEGGVADVLEAGEGASAAATPARKPYQLGPTTRRAIR